MAVERPFRGVYLLEQLVALALNIVRCGPRGDGTLSHSLPNLTHASIFAKVLLAKALENIYH